MENGISVLIVDDHPIYRLGLGLVLKKNPLVQRVFEAGNGAEAIELIISQSIQLVLMDLRMPIMDGYEAIKIIKTLNQLPFIFVLSDFLIPGSIDEIKSIGADAYLTKGVTSSEFSTALNWIHAGGQKPYLSAEVQEIVNNETPLINLLYPHPKDRLNGKEIRVLLDLTEEYTAKEIGQKIGITKNGVEYYKAKLFAKTGAKTLVGLVKFAIRNRLIKP